MRTCPLCGSKPHSFVPLDPYYENNLRRHGWPHGLDHFETLNIREYTCPGCGSGDRDRIYALFLRHIFSRLNLSQTYSVLEVAPAPALGRWIKGHPFISYRSCDLYMPEADDRADIHNLPYADKSYDFVICSHVLEHVDDPVAACREIRRVLKPGGIAILMSPILLTLEETYENPAVTTPAERWKHFGQDDHVRVFSKRGFRQMIKDSGLLAEEMKVTAFIDAAECVTCGIDPESVLYLGLREKEDDVAPRPKVSVVIPAYNHEKFVAAAVDSVLAQTFGDFELLIIDDGSSDGTPEVLKRYEGHPKVRLFLFSENQGAVPAFNHGISNTRGEYIALLNSDDVWKPEKLEKQVAFLDEHPQVGAVFSFADFIDENGGLLASDQHHYGKTFEVPNRSRHEWLSFFFLRNAICHPSMLIRRQCYETVGLYDPRYFNLPDYDMWIRLSKHFQIHILPEHLMCFRILQGERQASAPSQAGAVRQKNELMQVLRNYLSFPSFEDFNRTFPIGAETRIAANELIPFYLAVHILNHPHTQIHRTFALETLYEFMASEEKRKLVKERHGFKIQDLYRIAAAV